jgi:hypothetical protein
LAKSKQMKLVHRPDIKCPGYEATLAKASWKAPLMGRWRVARRLIAGRANENTLLGVYESSMVRFRLIEGRLYDPELWGQGLKW